MATESVPTADAGEVLSLTIKAFGEEQAQEEWRATGLPVGAAYRLAKAENAMRAVSSVSRLLRRDFLHDSDARASEGLKYARLTDFERDGLHLAQEVLGHYGSDMLDEVREFLSRKDRP